MKKRIESLLAVLLLTSLLAGCTALAYPLPDGMESEDVTEAATAVLDDLLAGNYQAVADAFPEDMRQELGVTADKIREIMDHVESAGAYSSTYKMMVVGGDRTMHNEPYGVAVVYCEHEETDVIYEMSFNMEMSLLGLSVKQQSIKDRDKDDAKPAQS